MGSPLSPELIDEAATSCRREPTKWLNNVVGARNENSKYYRCPLYEFAVRLRARMDPADPHFVRLDRNIRISQVGGHALPRMSPQQGRSLFALFRGCPYDSCVDEANAFDAAVEKAQGRTAFTVIANALKAALAARTDPLSSVKPESASVEPHHVLNTVRS
jgi:hypothetical protein